jgi:hypothetical protein
MRSTDTGEVLMKTHVDDGREIEDLVRLTQEVVASPTDDSKAGEWRAAVRLARAATLVGVTAKLSSIPGKGTRDIKALREAIISETNRKNTQDLILTMEKLDASATRLSRLSVILAIVGVALAVAQVYESFRH